MTRREYLLQVYQHKDINYVPCFYTDFDFCNPAEINERPEKGGLDWFGVEWEFVPAVMAPIFDQLAELGIDAIDPLQITNPIRAMKDKYPNRVTL